MVTRVTSGVGRLGGTEMFSPKSMAVRFLVSPGSSPMFSSVPAPSWTKNTITEGKEKINSKIRHEKKREERKESKRRPKRTKKRTV